MLFGGYEPNPAVALGRRRAVGARQPAAADRTRSGSRPLLAGRDPPLPVPGGRRRGQARLPSRRDDARRQPAARPDAGRPRLLDGGRPVAERLRRRRRHGQDRCRVDHDGRVGARRRTPIAPGASAGAYRDPDFTAAAAREAYRYYYRLRYPLDTDEWGRPQRLSPLHGRLQELGAVFGVEERLGAGRLLPPGPGRGGARAPTSASSAGRRRRTLDLLAEEHRAFRERVGIIDMTSFGKIEVSGPGALALLERVADNRIDRPGRSRRLHAVPERRAAASSPTSPSRAWRGALPHRHRRRRRRLGPRLAAAQRQPGDGPCRDPRRDRGVAVIGLWGPQARDGAAGASRTTTFPPRRSRSAAREIASAAPRSWRSASPTSASSASSSTSRRSGPCRSGTGWWRPASRTGSRPAATASLESLRIEKGYRYFGTDLTAGRRPARSRPWFLRRLGQGFIGRAALERRASRPRRLRTLLVGGERLPRRSTAARRSTRRRRRRPRAQRAATASRSDATSRSATLPADLEEGAEVGVEVFGELVPAEIAAGRPLRPRRTSASVPSIPASENRGLMAWELATFSADLLREPERVEGRGGDRPAGLARARDPRARRGRASHPARRARRISRRGRAARGGRTGSTASSSSRASTSPARNDPCTSRSRSSISAGPAPR